MLKWLCSGIKYKKRFQCYRSTRLDHEQSDTLLVSSCHSGVLKPDCVVVLNQPLRVDLISVNSSSGTEVNARELWAPLFWKQQINSWYPGILPTKDDLTKVGWGLLHHESSNCTNLLIAPHSYNSVLVSQSNSAGQKKRAARLTVAPQCIKYGR